MGVRFSRPRTEAPTAVGARAESRMLFARTVDGKYNSAAGVRLSVQSPSMRAGRGGATAPAAAAAPRGAGGLRLAMVDLTREERKKGRKKAKCFDCGKALNCERLWRCCCRFCCFDNLLEVLTREDCGFFRCEQRNEMKVLITKWPPVAANHDEKQLRTNLRAVQRAVQEFVEQFGSSSSTWSRAQVIM
jgi:hypothetical protein